MKAAAPGSSSGTNAQGSKGLSRYQLQQKGKQGQSFVRVQGQLERASNRSVGGLKGAEKTQIRLDGDDIDAKFGFTRFREVRTNDWLRSNIYCFTHFLGPSTIGLAS